ncbi:MAG: phospholipid carrier-dependent glycosyltransferase [Candidatus Binatia bacterium]
MSTAEIRGRQLLIPAGLLLVAAALRFWGITWAAPERIDLHPDEMDHVMTHALAVSFADPDPKFLNYPSFLIYAIALANGLLSRLGLVTESWHSYVVGRSIVATFGALTAPAAFWLGLEIAGSLGGAALAGLWVALMPLHVWESHFAVTDIVMTFWITVALALSVRLLRSAKFSDILLTGAVIGAGIASKYTAALVAISPLIAMALAARPLETTLRGLFGLGLAALTVCFLGTPFTFLHFSEFRADMAFEYAHVRSLHYGFSLPALGWQYHKYVYELFAGWPFSLGVALYAAAAAGAIWALVRPRRETVVVLGFALLFFAILGRWTFKPLRYQLPMLVIAAVYAGLWQGSWIEAGRTWQRAVATVAAVATLVYTAIFTIQTTARFRNDTRIQAARWLDETLPGRLLIIGNVHYVALPSDPRIDVKIRNEALIGKVPQWTDFDLAEITSMHYSRHERHRHHLFLPAYEHLRNGGASLQLVKRFEADFLNRDLYSRLDPMFGGYFISPTIEFYSRRDQPS